MKKQCQVLKPIPEKDMPKWGRAASQAHRRATRKKLIELRQRGLPMIIWKDGKVREVPAQCLGSARASRAGDGALAIANFDYLRLYKKVTRPSGLAFFPIL